MKGAVLSYAIVLSLANAAPANAHTVSVTSVMLGDTNNAATGSLTSISNSSPHPYGTASFTLFGEPWYGSAVEYFDDTSGTTLHFNGTTILGDDFDYAFALSEGQVAWGMFIDRNMSAEYAILNIMDCGAGNPGNPCTGIGTPMQGGPFSGVEISFNVLRRV